VREQIADLAQRFSLDPNPTLKYIEAEGSGILIPERATGLVAVPKDNLIGNTYLEAVNWLITEFARTSGRVLQLEHDFGPGKLVELPYTRQMMWALAAQQPGDFVLFAAQLGESFRHVPVRDAQTIMTRPPEDGRTEFGLRLFDVGCILLSHPDLLSAPEELYIECGGDRCTTGQHRALQGSPHFEHAGPKTRLGASPIKCSSEYYGVATGFKPTWASKPE